jgi:putative colanic acid biosynthesis UDP-glucose lipid carrier transferase
VAGARPEWAEAGENGFRSAPDAVCLELSAGDARIQSLYDGAGRILASAQKRLIDIMGAAAGLIVLAPFLFLVAILIKLESPGPVIFRQRRTGRGGRVFHIYKFRTMKVLEDGPVITQASADDGRRTRVGSFLRRSCIDELPQLFNVLIGEMSLVGPRPHAVAHDDYYSKMIPDYRLRFLVRPGIAGLAQVSGFRGETPTVDYMEGRVALDLEYIACWTLKDDVGILLRAVTEGPFHPTAV